MRHGNTETLAIAMALFLTTALGPAPARAQEPTPGAIAPEADRSVDGVSDLEGTGSVMAIKGERIVEVPPPRPIALQADRLIDGVSGEALPGRVLLVEGERIVAVGGREVIPAGAEVFAFGDATILPGLVDAHSHPLISADSYQIDHLRWSSAYNALRSLRAVQANLQRAGRRSAWPATPTCTTRISKCGGRSTTGCSSDRA